MSSDPGTLQADFLNVAVVCCAAVQKDSEFPQNLELCARNLKNLWIFIILGMFLPIKCTLLAFVLPVIAPNFIPEILVAKENQHLEGLSARSPC